MKRWLTVPMIGTGTYDNPFRPDLKGVPVQGWVIGAYSGTEALVKVVRKQPDLDALKAKAGVIHHGDEPLSATKRAVVITEARRLGAGANFDPAGYDVDGG